MKHNPILMKFGAQQQIWNSMTKYKFFEYSRWRTAAMLKISFWPCLSSRLPDFSVILRGELIFRRISAMGQILAFYGTLFLVFLMQFGLRQVAPFVSSPTHLFYSDCREIFIWQSAINCCVNGQ